MVVTLLHCVSKNIPNIFDCYLNKDYRILIIFVRIFLRQLAIKSLCSFLPYPSYVSALPEKIKTNEMLYFCFKWYYYLMQITHKNTFCLHS